MEDFTEGRLRISGAVQEDGPDFEGTVATLTGWVIVAEWMDSEGQKWLSKNSADAAGEQLTLWQTKGMLHEALFGDWQQPEEAGDDE